VVPSRVNADGTLTIKISIKNKRSTSYINTRFKVDSISEWRNGRVVNRPDAVLINKRLYELLFTYNDILERDISDSLTAPQIKDQLLLRTSGSNGIFGYRDIYMERIKRERSQSYYTNLQYTFRSLRECFGENYTFEQFNLQSLKVYERFLCNNGASSTTINIRMSHLKAFINSAIADGVAKCESNIFSKYKMPEKNIRDICISREELQKLKDKTFNGIAQKRLTIARDLFMLSFYCGGINLTDLLDAQLEGDYLTFVRKKTKTKTIGEKTISITIQPEARVIINKYVNSSGKIELGYNYSKYDYLRSFITHSLNRIGKELGFEKQLTFYSARKTFCQFGFELGIPLYILEYAIGQTIKDASNRPIFNYIKIMRTQADAAIRAIVDYSLFKE
jgi:site-specific recombinase XerD